MRTKLVFFALCLITWNQALANTTEHDLWWIGNLHFKKGSIIPFSGYVTGPTSGNFKYGRKEGTWITYCANGERFNMQDYQNGKNSGKYVSYDCNGNQKLIGQYNLNGEKHGYWKWFYSSGELWQEAHFENGHKTSWNVYEKDVSPGCGWGFFSQDGKRIPPEDGVWPDNDPNRVC